MAQAKGASSTRLQVARSAAALSLMRPFVACGAVSRVLRFIPQADLTILDPLATTAYVTRDHGHLCWDTLYGLDASFAPSPQLAAGHVVDDDGRRWIFTLRDGPTFHDGARIRASDAVASIRRWMPRDTYGQALARRLDEILPLDDRRFEIRLHRPFAPLLFALAKPWTYPCFVYPERFAVVDPATPLTEVVGSGPYRFVARERVAGARAVYEKFGRYIPTSAGPVSLTAGPKLAWFERPQWAVITDTATSAAALQAGEVDWWEAVPPDFRPLLARRRMRMSQSAAASCSPPSRTWQQRPAKLTCSRSIAAAEGKMQRARSSEYSTSFQQHVRFYKFILLSGRIGENPFQPAQSDHRPAPPLFRSAGIRRGRRAGSLREPPTCACCSELSWQP